MKCYNHVCYRLPMENAFVGPETKSSCLPRAYEDYGEPEHLLLYKTVEELKRERGEANKVSQICLSLSIQTASKCCSIDMQACSNSHIYAITYPKSDL